MNVSASQVYFRAHEGWLGAVSESSGVFSRPVRAYVSQRGTETGRLASTQRSSVGLVSKLVMRAYLGALPLCTTTCHRRWVSTMS